MPAHISLVYLNELSSPYDSFFLNWLGKVYDVTCITFNHNPSALLGTNPVVKVKDLPFRLPRLDGIRVWSLTLHRACLLKRLLNKINPDLAIGNDALSYGFYTALTNFKPFLLFIWGSDILIWPKKSLFFKAVAEYSLKKADAVLVDSDVQARACTELGAPVDKIIKAPWFDVNEVRNIKVDNEAKRKIRLRLGISKDEIIVISTRWHEPVYSVETLILAISELVKPEFKVRFLIMGGGSRTPLLKRLAERQGISNKIVFAGKASREKILEYLKVSDIYVSTSLSDGTSASLLEAMACELPAIVTDISGNKEWIVDGSNGLLFPVKDSKTLAEKIVRLLRDEDFRKSLGMKAYETVVKKANWQKNSKLLGNLIFSLVNTEQNSRVYIG